MSHTTTILTPPGAMSVDDADQCTFWYTNEYITATPSPTNGQWGTHVGAMSFPSCTSPSDTDGDTFSDCADDCPFNEDPLQIDSDGDGIGDVCDPCPVGQPTFASATLFDGCPGDGHAVRRDMLLHLDVTVTNPTVFDIPFLVGTLTGPATVQIIKGSAVFAPEPVPAFGSATARFTIAIEPSHPCPDLGVPFALNVAGLPDCAMPISFTVPLVDCAAGGGVGTLPDEVPNTSLRVTKNPPSGLHLAWAAAPGATRYNVYEGLIDSLFTNRHYDHVASVLSGAGTCSEANTSYDDPDDLNTPGNFYYLVAGKTDCGMEGTTGFDSFGSERPAGGGCP